MNKKVKIPKNEDGYKNTPDPKVVICEFLGLKSSGEISEKYNLDKDDVKLILRNSFPKDFYLKLAHTIGAKTVSMKLTNAGYRRKYSNKMKKSVSATIRSRMKNKKFREKWLKKAKLASPLGNRKIKELMKDRKFSETWSKMCSKGGKKSSTLKTGIFDPKIREKRIEWSLSGLRKTGRKVKGPRGEKMYNQLEVRVAKAILSSDLDYSYEKLIKSENLNGFYSIDFFLKKPPLIIEVTYWDKIKQKSDELSRKFNYFKCIFPESGLVLVTTKNKLHSYKRLLPPNIHVLTPDELRLFLAG